MKRNRGILTLFFASFFCLAPRFLLAAEPEPLEIDEEFIKRRSDMVEKQLIARGIKNRRVLAAMDTVPREIFLRHGLRFRAYMDDEPPVEKHQFLSRPYEWAQGLEFLEVPEEGRVLVLDPGIGYAGSLVSQIANETYVLVTLPELLYFVQQRFEDLLYSRVSVKSGALEEGWNEFAPYDRIFAAGALSGSVPAPLFGQLKLDGSLLVVEGKDFQTWVRYKKTERGIVREPLERCHFPPLELD